MGDVFSDKRQQQQGEPAAKADLFREVEPEKDPIEWVYVSVSEGSVILGRLYQQAGPTLDDLKALLPQDGQVHALHLDFRGSGSGSRGHAYPSLRAAAPAPLPAAALDPNVQLATMMGKMNDTIIELAKDTIASAREQRHEMAAARAVEVQAFNKAFEKLTDKLGTIEAARAVDPTTAVVKAAMPYAAKLAGMAKDLTMGFVLDAGGVKEAAGKVMDMMGGGGSRKSAILDKVMEVLGGIGEAFAERAQKG